MTLAVTIGILVGIGGVGMLYGMRPASPTLESIAAVMDRRPETADPVPEGRREKWRLRAGGAALVTLVEGSTLTAERWRLLAPYFAITGDSPERIASKALVLGGAGLLVPPLLWLAATSSGATSVPVGLAIVFSMVAASLGFLLPLVDLTSRARERRHHVRVVVGSFVDLVVLNLAGGMGIESALVSAAQVSSDWASQRISLSLTKARESGQSSWKALSQLGREIGVPELVEVSATLQLAGTEGARIRQSLSARADALRRHEQADAESAANRTTERLFLPGSLLLIGFLLFVGYPAFSRIVGGF